MNIKRIQPTKNIYNSENNFLELPKKCFIKESILGEFCEYANTVVYGLIKVDNIVFFCTIDGLEYNYNDNYFVENLDYAEVEIQVNFAVAYGYLSKTLLSSSYVKYYPTEELLKMNTAPVQVDLFNPDTFKCVKELLYVEGEFINDAMYNLINREQIKYSSEIIEINSIEDIEKDLTLYLTYIDGN